MSVLEKILFTGLGLLIVLNWGMLQYAIIRRIVARVGKRIGIPLYQPWVDLIKNYNLRSQISHGVMYYFGPVFRLTGAVGMFLFMPLIFGSQYFLNFTFTGDIVLVLYFQFFGMLGMALGSSDSAHPNATIGVSRGLSQFTTVELPLTLAIISLAVQYHTLPFHDIIAAQQGSILNWTVFTNPFATGAAMLSLLGLLSYSPFNLVRAPNEIPIGPPTEYHSTFLGVLQTSRPILAVMETVLFMNLFFGGADNWISFFVKTFLIYFWGVFVGVVFPRFRIEQSVVWFVKIPLALAIIGIIMIM